MERFVIEVDDPRREDIVALLEAHLDFARSTTPAENVYALDLDGLLEPAITFFSVRADGELLGVGALKQLDPEHLEIKSMHTAAVARRRGVARALVDHLVTVAASRGARRVFLETGTHEAFAPARALYANAGFVPCGPFGDYAETPDNTFMTRAVRLGEPPADHDVDLDDLARFVRAEIESYRYEVPEGTTLGRAWPAEKVERLLDEMRGALVSPEWRLVAIRDTWEQMKQDPPERRWCVLVALDPVHDLYFDPVEEDFFLAMNAPPESWGLRGDAVGCYMAR